MNEHLIIALLAGYFMGSIPFGLLLVQLAGKGDIRKVGSGTMGATNVGRVLGTFGFVLTWILDTSKAILPFIILQNFFGFDVGMVAGAAAILGHNYPIWFGFKNSGKGFSALLGFLLVLNPIAFVTAGLIWLIVALSYGYSSLAALVVISILPVLGFAVSQIAGLICTLLVVMEFFVYKNNIKRLLAGTEPKQANLKRLSLYLFLCGLAMVILALVVYLNV